MSDPIILSPEGKKKLEEELQDFKKNKRMKVAERIATAKEFGDLSENAEYHEAKEEQAFIEGRILELEHMLKVAQVVETSDSKEINVGSQVELEKDGNKMEVQVVGATEADPTNGKISLDSPLGTGMVGKKKGDEFEVKTPVGVVKYKIKKVS